jgi:hypothetical protein
VRLSADRNHDDDHGEWFVAAAMWLWYLLSHHDIHHWNIDHAESLSGSMPISLEHGGIRLATDRQFVWALWLYWSTN